MNRLEIREQWKWLGFIIPRTERGNENSVAGASCIVWDDDLPDWRVAVVPVEWIKDIPEESRRAGKGMNLWRQHILCLPSGEMVLDTNSRTYCREQMFAKISSR